MKIERKNRGITLVALVVTIVVLLILAGITLVYVLGDNSVFKQASEAKLKTDIANWQERLETAKSPIFIEGLGTFNPDAYFQYIQEQGIINNKDTDVIDNGDGTYDVTTKPGYVFLVTLMPTPEKPTDAEIEYIGQAGKIPPVIRRIEVSATATSITGKAIVSRLGNGTVTYYYKLSTAGDDSYVEITNVDTETGATQSIGITAGEEYIIKVVAKNEIGETEKTAKITATKIFVESITLNKENTTIAEGKTEKLIATVKPDNSTNRTLKWTSSNETIATVTDEGVVTGKTEGTATITVAATDGSNKAASCAVTVKSPTVADIVGETQTSNKITQDGNGNKITIPGGFKVVPNSPEGTEESEKVDYTYNGDGTPAVQDGIVIEDNEGNQFVWIPVGDIKNKDGSITTITLGRYTFGSDGTPALKQAAYSAENEENYTGVVTIEKYWQELNGGGTPILKGFVDSCKLNGGYYLGRYEASQGTDAKAKSQANKIPWGMIKKSSANTVAENMYSGFSLVSRLVNSYAWDTAIVFIEEYSEGNSNYANRKGAEFGTDLLNTGKAGDKVCNIHNMASNSYEWTTENTTYKSNGNSYSGTRRGGYYDNTVASRSHTLPSAESTDGGFRVVCYVR